MSARELLIPGAGTPALGGLDCDHRGRKSSARVPISTTPFQADRLCECQVDRALSWSGLSADNLEISVFGNVDHVHPLKMGVTQGSRTLICAVVLTLATSSQGLLTTASKIDGRYRYNFATVPFLAEILKLIVSTVFLRQAMATSESPVKMTRTWNTWVLFPVPSLIYVVHNNVQFYMLKYLNPSTYQILGNLKIITTGLLFRIFLGRRLSTLQWVALMLLMVGATTSQVRALLVA